MRLRNRPATRPWYSIIRPSSSSGTRARYLAQGPWTDCSRSAASARVLSRLSTGACTARTLPLQLRQQVLWIAPIIGRHDHLVGFQDPVVGEVEEVDHRVEQVTPPLLHRQVLPYD